MFTELVHVSSRLTVRPIKVERYETQKVSVHAVQEIPSIINSPEFHGPEAAFGYSAWTPVQEIP